MIQIKDFSKQSGFSIRMLRYLEEIKLLVPSRAENNYRTYTSQQIEIALQIKELQGLGFQLKEILDLNQSKDSSHKDILINVLQRETEVAEIKSETIPRLRHLLEMLEGCNGNLYTCLEEQAPSSMKMRTLAGDDKFRRTAYSIPVLRTIYEDHIAIETDIDLISTDLMKFGEFIEKNENELQVFSILRESSFSFGVNISDDFVEGFKTAWKKFLPDIDMTEMTEFDNQDIGQLMGQHDIVICTCFKYRDGNEGWIIVPYTPIYAMAGHR